MGIRSALSIAAGHRPPIPVPYWLPDYESRPALASVAFPSPSEWGPIDRGRAETIPVVAAGLSLFAVLGTLPLIHERERVRSVAPRSITNPDPECPGANHYARTYQDLLLTGTAYWAVTSLTGRTDSQITRPATFRQIDSSRVATDPDDPGRVQIDGQPFHLSRPGRECDTRTVVRFQGPVDGGILGAGRTALRTALLLESAAQRYADMDVPAGLLKNTSGLELSDSQIDQLLDGWSAARRKRTTAYINSGLEYQTVQYDASQLQLVEARREADSRIAQLMGIPPQYVNAPDAGGGGTIRYQNMAQDRRTLIDFTFAPYTAAVCGRLSMDDVTAGGWTVRHDYTEFLKADLAGLVALGAQAVQAGLISTDEWREIAGMGS